MIKWTAVAILLAFASRANAQTFLSRYAFHLDAEHLGSNDDRFSWDADLGGDIDLLDYGWEVAGALGAGYEIRPHVTFITGGDLRLVGTDGSRDRATQVGARGEAGIRLEGAAGAVELFVAGERR